MRSGAPVPTSVTLARTSPVTNPERRSHNIWGDGEVPAHVAGTTPPPDTRLRGVRGCRTPKGVRAPPALRRCARLLPVQRARVPVEADGEHAQHEDHHDRDERVLPRR